MRMIVNLLFTLLIFSILQSVNAFILMSQWEVTNANRSIRVLAKVPGGIYSDLRRANILQTPILYRFNDEQYRWVGYENWTYFIDINVSEDLLQSGQTFLVFNGVDTVATVSLNNQIIGECNNMFIKYKFPVSHILKVGMNSVAVEFVSPVLEGLRIAQTLSYPVPLECWPPTYKGECHINKLRKMQASFAWDWGPAFPSMGLWKAVHLQVSKIIVMEDVGVVLKSYGKNWKVILRAWFDAEEGMNVETGELTAALRYPNGSTITAQETVTPALINGHLEARIQMVVPKDSVELWWPNGYGDQPLYEISVSYLCRNDFTEKKIKIGFRVIELIQAPVSDNVKDGLTFFFRVNGVDVFAKGSNWIPSHILPEMSADPVRVSRLLNAAKESHFNMLRVWGGGLYESDLFYTMCDELGIMVWQDLMFACNMYPAKENFLDSVRTEVRQQVNRLQYHPSIAIWAGNNENEAALRGNWYGTQRNFETYKADYIKLYVHTIKPVVEFTDPTRPFVTSSPSNGVETEKEDYVADNPSDSHYGDVHYYNYLSNGWNWLIYPKSRFTSEYGMQSLPSVETLAEIALPNDLTMNSTLISHRQHLGGGQEIMLSQIDKNLPLPSDLESLVYLSQVNQAMTMKIETECYRRDKNVLYSSGEGLTMGALYWQFNDIWQAPSWSSIDYSGRWKMLQYYMKDAFAPIILSPKLTVDDSVSLYVVSDQPNSIQNALLHLSVHLFESPFSPERSHTFKITVVGNKSEEKIQAKLKDFVLPYRHKSDYFILFQLVDSNGALLAPDNFLFLDALKLSPIQPANVEVLRVETTSSTEAYIYLKTDRIAFFVWLAVSSPGHFSENGFIMKERTKTVKFKGYSRINLEEFLKKLQVQSLKPEYQNHAALLVE